MCPVSQVVLGVATFDLETVSAHFTIGSSAARDAKLDFWQTSGTAPASTAS